MGDCVRDLCVGAFERAVDGKAQNIIGKNVLGWSAGGVCMVRDAVRDGFGGSAERV